MSVIFLIGVLGETFRIAINNPNVINDAVEQYHNNLEGKVTKHVNGALLAGDGGFNFPWSWHIDPDDIVFAEFSIELCDGTPSMVENHLDYWLNAVKRFCPWHSKVLSIPPTKNVRFLSSPDEAELYIDGYSIT